MTYEHDKDAAILALIDRLSNEIKVTQTYSLEVTTRLLQTAILDLRAWLYSISDDELRSFADSLEAVSQQDDKPAHNCS